jgi:hypothetical protein
MMSDVAALIEKEPWRLGSGQPVNALDPTWTTERSKPCGGDIEYETGTKWWWCKKCGCCGSHDFAKMHRAINDPSVYCLQSVEEYLKRREQEGISREHAIYQMFHVAGVALRYAASVPTEELASYIKQLVVR